MNEAYQQYFAAVYDRLMDDMPYAEWQQFVRDAWQRFGIRPRTVVDLGCGTGRNAIAFAQDGIALFGIDLSEHMLAVAQQQAESAASAIQAAGGSLHWLQQNMRDWEIGRQADSVICLCDGINYLLADEDVQSTFRQTYDGLQEGGVFIFDVLTVHQYEQYAAEQPFTYDDEELAYIWYSDWQPADRIITHDLTMFVQQDAETDQFLRFYETHQQRAYELPQLKAWLTEAGFRRIECYADMRWQAPTASSARVFFCAVK